VSGTFSRLVDRVGRTRSIASAHPSEPSALATNIASPFPSERERHRDGFDSPLGTIRSAEPDRLPGDVPTSIVLRSRRETASRRARRGSRIQVRVLCSAMPPLIQCSNVLDLSCLATAPTTSQRVETQRRPAHRDGLLAKSDPGTVYEVAHHLRRSHPAPQGRRVRSKPHHPSLDLFDRAYVQASVLHAVRAYERDATN
jgi:hypothetical protein